MLLVCVCVCVARVESLHMVMLLTEISSFRASSSQFFLFFFYYLFYVTEYIFWHTVMFALLFQHPAEAGLTLSQPRLYSYVTAENERGTA